MYGMGLGISVWDGSRDQWWHWCMLEGPLTETLSSCEHLATSHSAKFRGGPYGSRSIWARFSLTLLAGGS